MPEFLWKWRREIVFALLTVISIGLLVSQREPGLIAQTLRQSMSFIIVPFQKISVNLVQGSRDLAAQTVSVRKLRDENSDLRHKVEKLTLRNTLLQEQVHENETLRTELAYKDQSKIAFLPAEVIARDPVNWLERAVVDRGSSDEVRAGTGVITPMGVAGRVREVSLYSSTVMLLLDTESSVAGIVERSQVNGTVKGTGRGLLKMMYVSSEDDVKLGDMVVTSKVSSFFPAGLPIGEVVHVAPAENGLMLDISIKPKVALKTLDRVLILMKED